MYATPFKDTIKPPTHRMENMSNKNSSFLLLLLFFDCEDELVSGDRSTASSLPPLDSMIDAAKFLLFFSSSSFVQGDASVMD